MTILQMYRSLFDVLLPLPGDASVFPGHEYTESNLRFALSVDAANEAVIAKLDWAIRRRKALLPTVPSSLAEEATFNPFLRVTSSAIQTVRLCVSALFSGVKLALLLQAVLGRTLQSPSRSDLIGVLALVRTRKNQFK